MYDEMYRGPNSSRRVAIWSYFWLWLAVVFAVRFRLFCRFSVVLCPFAGGADGRAPPRLPSRAGPASDLWGHSAPVA